MRTYRDSLKNIQTQLNKELTAEERIEFIKQLLPDECFVFGDDEEFKAIFEYINSREFWLQNRHKKKTDPLYENTYLAIGLSNISDYLLEKWGEWEGGNFILEDYSIQSRYDLERLAKAGNKKSIVGFDTSVADDFLENSYSKTVLEKWEFHVDQLEKHTRRTDDIFNFSEDAKRAARKQLVLENLDNPVLREKYIVYKELGFRYGFDESLSPEQKEQMKKQWIEHFAIDKNHPVRPKKRYYELLKMYNDIGYELYKIIEQSQVKAKRNKQPLECSKVVRESRRAFMTDDVKLDNPLHVNAILSIKKGKRMGEYFPIYVLLQEENKDDKDCAFSMIDSELNETLEVADLSDMQRDIVKLIMGVHQELNIYKINNRNPYEHIANYVNEKYRQKKTKTDIVKIVEKNISRTIANTYNDLESGLDMKKCTSCKVEKMASEHNFGREKKGKDGLKSICKKCASKREKYRRYIV